MSALLTLLLLLLLVGLVVTGGTVALSAWGVRRLGRVAGAALRARSGAALGDVRRRPVASGLVGRGPRRGLVEVRAWLPGPVGRVPALRRDLVRDVDAAARAVQAGAAAGRPVEVLVPLVRRLRRAAGELDLDLSVIGGELWSAERERLMAGEQPRLDAVHRSCRQVRRAVLLAGSAASGPTLHEVERELDEELVRLGLWSQAHAELLGPA